MTHLREVSVYFDDKRLAHLSKDAAIPKQLPIPQGLRTTSPMGFMNIKTLKSTRRRFIGTWSRFVLITVTLHSSAHYRRSNELGLRQRPTDNLLTASASYQSSPGG